MNKIVILAAEEAEYNMCRKYLPEAECILMGVGAGNVIRTCCALPEGTGVINIGYAGSNRLEIGTVGCVSESYRLVNGTYFFTDHANPLPLPIKQGEHCYPCHTSNDFVTESAATDPTLFDMELNYIAAFCPRINLLASIKIVSDNLCIDTFRAEALRESGILSSPEVWERVAALYRSITAAIGQEP